MRGEDQGCGFGAGGGVRGRGGVRGCGRAEGRRVPDEKSSNDPARGSTCVI